MAKTIQDYQKDYQEARKRGDAAGMQAANDGANAIRKQQGQAEQKATADINKYKGSSSSSSRRPSSSSSSSSGRGNGGGSNGWTEHYKGGNASLDSALKPWQDAYNDAREKGDWEGMQNANNEANKIRNEYGYAAQHATSDINHIRGQSSGSGSGGYAPSQMQSPVEDLSDYLDELYAAQRKNALAQLESAYNKNLSALDQSKVGVAEQYQDARNQAAGASEQAKRNFAEYAAASGLNSGAADQAELSRTVGLQGDLNSLSRNEADFFANIELQKAQAEQDYNNAIAQAEASNDFARAQALYEEKVRVQEALTQQQLQQMQMEFQQSQLKYQQQRDQVADMQFDREAQMAQDKAQYDRQWELAQWMAQYGDFSGLAALGVPKGTIDQVSGYWNEMTDLDKQKTLADISATNRRNASSGRSGGGGGGNGNGMSLSIAKQYFDQGLFDDSAYAALRAAGYSDELLASLYGYDPYHSDFKQSTGQYRHPNVGQAFTTDEYNNFVYKVGMMATDVGRRQLIKDAHDEGKISEDQAEALIRQFRVGQ